MMKRHNSKNVNPSRLHETTGAARGMAASARSLSPGNVGAALHRPSNSLRNSRKDKASVLGLGKPDEAGIPNGRRQG